MTIPGILPVDGPCGGVFVGPGVGEDETVKDAVRPVAFLQDEGIEAAPPLVKLTAVQRTEFKNRVPDLQFSSIRVWSPGWSHWEGYLELQARLA